MSNRRGGFVEGKVYVGGLPEDATSEELDDAFHKFGRIRKIWVARRPPGFAFVEFDDHRDAEDAVRAMDGTRICGVKARVELSVSASGRGPSGGGRGFRGGGGGGYGGGGGGRDGYRDRSRDRRDRDRDRSSLRSAVFSNTHHPSISSTFSTSSLHDHLNLNHPSLSKIVHPKFKKFGSAFANAG
ncbi:hypothetical protein ACQ4LE_002289 [Meloidogyne hapla]